MCLEMRPVSVGQVAALRPAKCLQFLYLPTLSLLYFETGSKHVAWDDLHFTKYSQMTLNFYLPGAASPVPEL